jgi:hypothetical protein
MAGPERVDSLARAFESVPDKRGKFPRFKSKSSPNVIIIATDPGSIPVLLRNPNILPYNRDESPKSKTNSRRT